MFDARLLTELKTAGYRPLAWHRYLLGHLRQVHELIEARPAAMRSILATAFVMLAVIFVAAVPVAIWVDESLGRRLFFWSALWLSLHSVWLLMHIGLLVAPEGRPCLRLGLPNTVTLLRSLTVPGMVVLMLEGKLQLAFVLYGVGAIADVADGALARRRGEVTRLGTVMDPLVDMGWNSAAAYGLMVAGQLPGWIFGLVAMRYGLLLVGSALLYLIRTVVRIRPTLFGKASGATISAAFMLTFLNRMLLPPAIADRVAGLIHLALGFLVSATIVYIIVLGILNCKSGAAPEPRGLVVGHLDEHRVRGAGHGSGSTS